MNLPVQRTHVAVATTGHTVSFPDLMRQAEVLAQSRIIPAAYRNRSADVVAAGLAGQAFGWDVMTSLRNYHVIEGTASLRPEAMLGLVRRLGHSVVLGIDETADGKVAHATGTRADNGDKHTATFSEADAERAGLANKKNWKQYLEPMLTWRAVSQLCRVLFPDVVLGAGYTPEEIGADVTASGDLAEPDPFSDPLIPIAEAKRRLLDACGGNKEEARSIWEAQPELPPSSGLRESEVDDLVAQATEFPKLPRVETAQLKQSVATLEAHLGCDRCGNTVPDGAGHYVEDGTVRVCQDCEMFYCPCGADLGAAPDGPLCAECAEIDPDEPLKLDGVS